MRVLRVLLDTARYRLAVSSKYVSARPYYHVILPLGRKWVAWIALIDSDSTKITTSRIEPPQAAAVSVWYWRSPVRWNFFKRLKRGRPGLSRRVRLCFRGRFNRFRRLDLRRLRGHLHRLHWRPDGDLFSTTHITSRSRLILRDLYPPIRLLGLVRSRLHRMLRIGEPPALVVIMIVLSDPRATPKPQLSPRLGDGLDAGADQN